MLSPAFTTEQLIAGMNTLPLELYDQVKSLVLSIDDEPYVRIIDKDYKQPVQLQLNREIRRKLVKKYYGDGAVWVAMVSEPEDLFARPVTHARFFSALCGLWSNRPSTTAHQGSFARWADSRSHEAKRALWGIDAANVFFPLGDYNDLRGLSSCHDGRHWHIQPWDYMTDVQQAQEHLLPDMCICTRWSGMNNNGKGRLSYRSATRNPKKRNHDGEPVI